MSRDVRTAHGLSRRDFLKRSAGAAVALPAAAEILAACTKPGSTSAGGLPYEIARPENPVTLPMNGDPIPSDTPIEQGAELQILNWSSTCGSTCSGSSSRRIRRTAITYTAASTFQNMDEGIAKLEAGAKADVFFPTIDVLGKLVAADLLQPLNHDLLPALEQDNWGVFQDPYYDQGWRYSVPYVIYTTGIGYRRDHIPDDVIHGMDNPWEILWDPQYAGKVGAYPSYRDVMAIALMKNGITDLNTGKESDLEKVRQDLLALTDGRRRPDLLQRRVRQAAQGHLLADDRLVGRHGRGLGVRPPVHPGGLREHRLLVPARSAGTRRQRPDRDPEERRASERSPTSSSTTGSRTSTRWTTSPGTSISHRRTRRIPTRLTTTEGLYSKLSTWAAPAMYVAPWMPVGGRAAGGLRRRLPRGSADAGGRRPLARRLGGIHRRCPNLARHHPGVRRAGRAAPRSAEGVHYPRWFWPSFSLPAILWLLILFVLPFYTVISIAFGTVDPIFRSPAPRLPAVVLEHRAVRRDPRQGLRHLQPGLHPHVPVRVHRERDLPGPGVRDRLLRRSVRRQAEGAPARAADLAVLDQLPDADAGVDQPARQRRVRQQGPDVPERRGPTRRLARGPAQHRDPGSRVRLHPVHDPAAVRVPRPDRRQPARVGTRSRWEPVQHVLPRDAPALQAGHPRRDDHRRRFRCSATTSPTTCCPDRRGRR